MSGKTIPHQATLVFLTPYLTMTIIVKVSGCCQAVRQQLPKLPFVGSNPITRSHLFNLKGNFIGSIHDFE